jgi:hypothetical protein
MRAQAAIKTVRERIFRNPLWKQKIMGGLRAENIGPMNIAPHQGQSTHESASPLLNPALKAIGWTRAERLLQWHDGKGQENILFTDKKIFTIEEQYNHQNNKIYDQTAREVEENVPWVQGSRQPSYVMVWW